MVYKGRCKRTKKEVAIKLIKLNIDDQDISTAHIKSTLAEVQILQKLSVRPENLYTTKLLDLIMPVSVPGEMLEWVILVMEYLPSDLRKALVNEQMTHLTEEHITIILYNLLSGIDFIHAAGLVHRDLKPANILVDNGC